jgi:hypothetical protein
MPSGGRQIARGSLLIWGLLRQHRRKKNHSMAFPRDASRTPSRAHGLHFRERAGGRAAAENPVPGLPPGYTNAEP